MKKLNNHIRITEIDDISDRLVLLYSKESRLQSDQFLKSVLGEIETLSEEITKSLKRDSIISNLEDADTKRDKVIKSLNHILMGYASMPIEDLKQKGDKLHQIFKKYGTKITTQSYSTASSLIESLIKDFENDEIQADIDALQGVRETLEALKTEQRAFNALRVNYETAVSKKQNEKPASTLKKPILELINAKLIPYLTAMKLANAASYQSFCDAVAQIINLSNETIKRRITKAQNGSVLGVKE